MGAGIRSTCTEKLKHRDKYDAHLSELGLVDNELRLTLSAACDAGDRHWAGMVRRSTILRQAGELPLEEVIDFASSEEVRITETAVEGFVHTLCFVGVEAFELPGTYLWQFGGAAMERTPLFTVTEGGLLGVETRCGEAIAEAKRVREEALARIQLDESNVEASQAAAPLIEAARFLLTLQSATLDNVPPEREGALNMGGPDTNQAEEDHGDPSDELVRCQSGPEMTRSSSSSGSGPPLRRSESDTMMTRSTSANGSPHHEPIYHLERTQSHTAGLGARNQPSSGSSLHGPDVPLERSRSLTLLRLQQPHRLAPLSRLSEALVGFCTAPEESRLPMPEMLEKLSQLRSNAQATASCLERFAELLSNMRSAPAVHTILQALQSALAAMDTDGAEEAEEENQALCNPAHPKYHVGLDAMLRHRVRQGVHTVLSSIGELLVESKDPLLRMMCLRCVHLDYTASDYAFLQDGPLITGLRAVMNATDHEEPLQTEAVTDESMQCAAVACNIGQNVSGMVELTASTGADMVPSLLDGSTDTFWQSGRNQSTANLTVVPQEEVTVLEVALHLDHTRLKDHKVRSVALWAGPDEEGLVKLRTVVVKPDFAGGYNLTHVRGRDR